MQVIKRSGKLQKVDKDKIYSTIKLAAQSVNREIPNKTINKLVSQVLLYDKIPIEEIQDQVEQVLMNEGSLGDVAKAYILYREQHKQARFIKERLDYMDNYSKSKENAATSSETDSNANVTLKNVANLEGEVYKTTNRIIQRQSMKDKLYELYPEVAKSYEKDLNHHIIYTHDEATTPVLKMYCMAVSLYPLMIKGVGEVDGVTPGPPNDISSFSGQIANLAFLLSSQCKGAVAFGEYFVALNYYVIKEYGSNWYDKLDELSTSEYCLIPRTVKEAIYKAFKQFVWGINQPAGNRSYQSPFVNISYFDHTYFSALFHDFVYPDGSHPEWKAIDNLQRLFINWFNNLRLKQVLAFPVETLAMVHNGQSIIDTNYRDLCAEMYSKGHSFFTYISDSADSLSSCCRLQNKLAENTFSPTSGLTGVKSWPLCA